MASSNFLKHRFNSEEYACALVRDDLGGIKQLVQQSSGV